MSSLREIDRIERDLIYKLDQKLLRLQNKMYCLTDLTETEIQNRIDDIYNVEMDQIDAYIDTLVVKIT